METILYLVFLVRYVAFVAGALLVGALVISAVREIVRRKLGESRVLGFAAEQMQAEGSAL